MDQTLLPGHIVFANLLYLVSIVLFMLGIQQMGRVKSARQGNALSAFAMLLAVVGQFIELGPIDPTWIVAGLVIGSVLGALAAYRVQMTQMPEMVALLNGSGGFGSMFVALAQFAVMVPVMSAKGVSLAGAMNGFNGIALAATIAVGAVTGTGSVVAWGKLSGTMDSKPQLLPNRHLINGALVLATVILSILLVWGGGPVSGTLALVLLSAVTLVLGVGLVIAIGGGDMPVVISLLNSYSGLAAALAGFTINSPVLIVSGSMVGAAGLILTQIMCKAMNRSLTNVLFGGLGTAEGGGGNEGYSDVKRAEPEEAAMILETARSLVIVPGYGMAVSQAQHAVRELDKLLTERGVTVRYAIHPVAGRMPGHMNVLLAEADVPYEKLFEMDQINADFKHTDAVLIIGANDVVNPAALDDPQSPIYGMPILEVHHAGTVFVIKRSLSSGFAGIKNPLFEAKNTLMLFGDAKKIAEDLTKALKEA